MKGKNTTLNVTIGAALQTGFGSVLSGASSRIQKVGSTIRQLGKESLVSAKSIEVLQKKYKGLNATMNARNANIAARGAAQSKLWGVAGLAMAAIFPIREAMKFETAMADVNKVMDFKAPDGLSKLSDDLLKMSTSIPLTAVELSQIAASGGQRGVLEKDIVSFTEQVAKVTTAFDMTAEEAGSSLAKLSNVFNIDITKLTDLGDAINLVSNKTGVLARDIIPALTRTGGVARQFGLTAEQTTAFTASLIAAGSAPEEAGTATAALLQRLQTTNKASLASRKAFQKIGLSAAIFPKLIREDPQGALSKFFKAMERLDPSERTGVLLDIFGRNYAKTAATIVGSLDKYNYRLSLIGDKTLVKGSMEKEYLARLATTENSAKLTKNALVANSIAIGKTVLSTVKEIFDSLVGVFKKFTDFLLENKVILGSFVKVTMGLIAFKIAAVLGGLALTYLKAPIYAVTIALKSMSLGIKLVAVAFKVMALASPLRALKLLWVGIGVMIAFGRPIKKFFSDIGASISKFFSLSDGELKKLGVPDYVISSWSNIKVVFNTVFGFISEKFSAIKAAISKALSLDKIGAKWNSFTDSVMKNWNAFLNFMSGIGTGISNFFKSMGQSIQSVFSTEVIMGKLDKFSDLISGFISDISQPFVDFGGLIKRVFTTENIIAAWGALATFMKNLWTSVIESWGAFKTYVSELSVVDGIMNAWTAVKNLFSSIFDGALKMWNSLKVSITSFFGNGSIFGKIFGGAKNLFKSVFSSDDKAVKLPKSVVETTSISKPFEPGMRVSNSNNNNNNNNHNTYTIHINAPAGASNENVANLVVDKIKETRAPRGYLFDRLEA